MADILDKYSRASGQMINLSKSRIVFSANANEEQKREVKSILQIEDAPNTGTYLGIPSFWGKTKRQAMNYVKEKIMKKMSVWKQNLLNQAGKEVLIKSVASAIPIYTMQCFKIPKKTCDEINSAMANFYWGEGDNANKIHWKGWKFLTNCKSEGGIGFRDLNSVNIACLGKQIWRLINHEDALWAKVLKGIYFPNSTIWEARKGAHASWAWTSILEGRDFVRTNCQWLIRDGTSVNIWTENWIVKQGRVVLKEDLDEVDPASIPQLVSDLIDKENNIWKTDLIQNRVTEQTIQAIQQMPISIQGGKTN